MQLQVESIAICDAACAFCPYPTMKRQRGTMDMGLFKKIIDDAATIPPIDKVTITGLGEPLLDKHLIERLKYIRKHMKIGCLDIYTNGHTLTIKKVKELMNAGVDVLYVSLNAMTKANRFQIMALDDYDEVTAVLDEALRITKDSSMKVVVKAVSGKSLMEGDEVENFVKRWNGPVEAGGNCFLHLEGNWAGVTYPMRIKPLNTCHRAIDQIMVLWDGRVSLCCFDGEGEVIFGDLNNQDIRDVFNGDMAREYREAHMTGRRGEMKLCADCSSI